MLGRIGRPCMGWSAQPMELKIKAQPNPYDGTGVGIGPTSDSPDWAHLRAKIEGIQTRWKLAFPFECTLFGQFQTSSKLGRSRWTSHIENGIQTRSDGPVPILLLRFFFSFFFFFVNKKNLRVSPSFLVFPSHR